MCESSVNSLAGLKQAGKLSDEPRKAWLAHSSWLLARIRRARVYSNLPSNATLGLPLTSKREAYGAYPWPLGIRTFHRRCKNPGTLAGYSGACVSMRDQDDESVTAIMLRKGTKE